jgi:serine/threonine-protein kinase
MRTQELLSAGDRCGPYTVVREIGRGGFGVVYLAEDTKQGRAALKVMPLDARRPEAMVARFQREIHVVAAITHANLVRFFEAGRWDGPAGSALWVALEYLEGQTLREILNDHQDGVVLVDALHYCVQVADGLTALHKLGVVHRDIKPENAMRIGSDIIKVFDLGIAKVAGARHTTGHMSVGTAPYMAPEQFESSDRGGVGAWTDVYAVGLLLYELITGKQPIVPEGSATTPEIIGRALMFTPPPLSELHPACSAELSAIALKAVAKNSADRYRTMSEFRDALDSVLMRERLSAHAASLATIGGDWTPRVLGSHPGLQPEAVTDRLPASPSPEVRPPVTDRLPASGPPTTEPLPNRAPPTTQPMPDPALAATQELASRAAFENDFGTRPVPTGGANATAKPAALDATTASPAIGLKQPGQRQKLPAPVRRPPPRPTAGHYSIASIAGLIFGFSSAAVLVVLVSFVKGLFVKSAAGPTATASSSAAARASVDVASATATAPASPAPAAPLSTASSSPPAFASTPVSPLPSPPSTASVSPRPSSASSHKAPAPRPPASSAKPRRPFMIDPSE